MRSITLIVLLGIIATNLSLAQKAEVIYFKAELACCQAKACDALEADIKAIVEKNFDSKVSFKEIKIADEANRELVKKYNAKSQTVLIVTREKKKETVTDISDLVRRHSRTNDKQLLEKDFVAKVNETIK
jgi:TRAP-type C4-dicarboxylate transport system substrate-binding protein